MKRRRRVKFNPEKMLIVPSKSRYDLSLERWGNEEAARKRFKSERKWNEIEDSDTRQKDNLGRITSKLGKNRIIDRSNLTPSTIEEYDLFVFLGGDDHFTYCSQNILKYMKEHPGEKKYVMGVVLDQEKSHGGLLNFNVDEFLALSKLEFLVGEWTTLEAEVDYGAGKAVPYPAVGTLFIGEYANLDMSRSDVYEKADEHGEPIMPEKSSGILVVTGAGSTEGAWYDNVYHCYFDKPDEFKKREESARIILRENKSRSWKTLHEGQSIYIDSYNDTRGIIAPDAHEDHSVAFDIGSVAEVKISDLKLKVVEKK